MRSSSTFVSAPTTLPWSKKTLRHALAVLHDELAAPARLAEQREHVAQRARRRDLAGDAHDRAVLGVAAPVFARVAHEHDVPGRRQHPERAGARAHALPGHGTDRVGLAPRIDADELVARLFHVSLDSRPAACRCPRQNGRSLARPVTPGALLHARVEGARGERAEGSPVEAIPQRKPSSPPFRSARKD